jgi:hypothetical protein
MEEEEDIVKIIKDLKTQGKQEQAAGRLYYYLIKHRIEPDTLIDKLRDLLFSAKKVEQAGGLLAVNKILEVGRETKVHHFVSQIMPSIFRFSYQYDLETMSKAIECIGNLAQSGGSSNSENIESHIETCFEWVRNRVSKVGIFGSSDSKSNNKRIAGILVLTQLCAKSPTIAYNKLISANNRYLKLFETLSDSRDDVRTAAVEFFKAINKLIIQRDPNERKNFYDQIYNGTLNVFGNSSDLNYIHGALLVTGFLLCESEDLMKDKHHEMFNKILKLREKKSTTLQSLSISLFPVMAKCNPNLFYKMMENVMKYLLTVSNGRSTLKGEAMRALGKLSVIISREHFSETYVYNIILSIGTEISLSKGAFFNDALD